MELIDERWGLLDYFQKYNIETQSRQLMNMNRITAHFPLFSYKLLKAIKLGLLIDGSFNTLIDEYLSKNISQIELIGKLAVNVKLPIKDYRRQLLSLIQLGMVEFHPTDICNNHCKGCIFSQSSNVYIPTRKIFPYSNLDVFRNILPKTMILVGGGEPTIYRDGEYCFTDLISRIVGIVPGIRLGLVTNGIYKPEFNGWEKHIDFVRISLGAHNRELYIKNKGSDSFDKILENATNYIKSTIPLVSFNYMINRETFEYCIEYARYIYRFVKEHVPQHLSKCSVQYRALIYSPNLSRITNKTLESDNLDVLPEQIEAMRKAISLIYFSREEFNFIINNTNLEDCLQGTKSHNPEPFDYCVHALIFGQIRANGNVQPCNVRSDDPAVRLGDIESEEGLIHLAVKQFKVFFKDIGDKLCDAQYCRRHGKNSYFIKHQDAIELNRKQVNLKLSENEIVQYMDRYMLNLLSNGLNFFF